MDGITDFAFRHIHATKGKPTVMFTEFTHVEGMWHGRPQVLENFLYHTSHRPIIAQIYGNKPDYFYKATIMVCALGFDGVDINMGCPAKNVTHSGGGAALIGNPALAKQIIRSVQKAVQDWTNGITLAEIGIPQEKIEYIGKIKALSKLQNKDFLEFDHWNLFAKSPCGDACDLLFGSSERSPIPVSVKTRIGIEQPQTLEWIENLLSVSPSNISLHGRTLKQMYTGQADYAELHKAAEIIQPTATTFLLNGDITSKEDALQKITTTGADGALIGRAAMGNPWIWESIPRIYTPEQRFIDALAHAKIHAATKDEKLFIQMRKHFGFYIKDFPYANETKIKLIRSSTLAEAETIIHEAQKFLAIN